MKKLLSALILLAPFAVQADVYQLTFGWTDPTNYVETDAPVYEAKHRVAGGAETVVPGLTTPAGSVQITAMPGDPVDVAARACNLGLCSDWTAWATATAPHPATQPGGQQGLTITITRVGP